MDGRLSLNRGRRRKWRPKTSTGVADGAGKRSLADIYKDALTQLNAFLRVPWKDIIAFRHLKMEIHRQQSGPVPACEYADRRLYENYGESLKCLLESYSDWHASATAKLEGLIDESEALLAPFSDPLRRDSWSEDLLSGRNEPHFSRWLKWLLQQIQDPTMILALFGDEDPELVEACRDVRARVVAEEFSLFGHSDRTGRLDLVVSYPRTAMIAIEVKLDCAEKADLPKQEGYRRWLDCQGLPEDRIKRYLLALDGEQVEFDGGFRLRRWRELTLALRRVLPAIGRSRGYTELGIALYFLSCSEQYVLSLISLEEAQRGRVTDPRKIELTAEYLEKCRSTATQDGDQSE